MTTEVLETKANKCQRCNGMLFRDYEEVYCLNCGWCGYKEEQTLVEQSPIETYKKHYTARAYNRKGNYQRGHYSKVTEVKPLVIAALLRGMGIRQASRKFNLAINTIRKIVRVDYDN
ncbi:hypothetical protein LCGC14_1970780 [marine sediment metagenome]|uniref:Uncharacterized protein n=1 Tax=marine sediment metagenome TaxID=412755 RepID=A0A0F9HQ66_9ZZZZ